MKAGPQADPVYLSHMLECIERILAYCLEGEASFRRSSLIQDAVIRNLQTMAESSQRLSDSTKALAPEIPWRALSGFRNIIRDCPLGAPAVLFGCKRRIGGHFCPSSAPMAQAMGFSVGTKLPRHCIRLPSKP